VAYVHKQLERDQKLRGHNGDADKCGRNFLSYLEFWEALWAV